MLRLLPLLAFAIVPGVAAAPVPPEPAPEFGACGTVTRAELEQLKFDSRPDAEGAKRVKEAEKEEAEEVEKRVAPDGPPKPRSANPYDVAVHMPATRFRAGEPIPAYFVLRNNRRTALRLRSRIDVCAPTPHLRGEYAEVTVRDRATGKPVADRLNGATNCDGAALVIVPADGFYCVKADLTWLSERGLPPGQYDVSWRYDGLRSAPVPFSILKRDGAKAPPRANRATLFFFHLTNDAEASDRTEPERGAPIVWRDAELSHVYTDDLAASLAVGQHGVYAPDVRSVPKADKLVEAWAEWLPYRDGDRIRVTLRATAPHKEVRFDDVPQLYLMLEAPELTDARAARQLAEERKLLALDRSRSRATPLTIEARLPEGWRDLAATPGGARVAVLASAGRVELPLRDEFAQKEQLKEVSDTDPDERPVWRGFVRTEFTEIRFQHPYLLKPQKR